MTEFEGWLRKGLGRAAIFLKTHPPEHCRAPLLHACTHNLTYDSQCEESRGPYLVNLIEASSDAEFYRDRILSVLAADEAQMDLGQLFEISARFAANGDHELKQAMYTAFDRFGFANAGIRCAEELVRLDGLHGLLFVAKSFGDIEADERPWQFGNLVDALEKRDGKQAFPPELDRFAREWHNQEEHWEQERQKPIKPRQNYETLKLSLTRAGAMAWARTATPDELALVAEDLRIETDEDRLVACLRMFRRHVFPQPIDRLLDLARAENDDIARAALVALSNVVDSRVRALGLDLIRGLKWRGFAVGLLTRNAERGDYRVLEGLLGEAIDPYIYHCMGIDVRHFVEAHRSEEAERSLLLLYENGPCSLCRHGAVEELIAIDRLPAWIRSVCSETRKKVEKQVHIVIPEGTKVLTRPGGRVGIVAHAPSAPEHSYRVRFADGPEESFRRVDLTIFKHVQDEVPGGLDVTDLCRFVIYRCVVGSTAYGLSQEGSDMDRRGFYLPPADLEWSLASVPEQLETDNEEVYWEIEKFIRLALKANPNVLECFYSPLVETCTPLAQELINLRQIFLSQYVHRTYNSYVLSQFKKLEQDLRNHGQIRWKHVMHLIRLLLSGVLVLRHGFVPLRVDEYRDRLVAIRRGDVPWEDVERWRLTLHKELDDALKSTPLPEHPDYARANEFLIHARRISASAEYTA